MKNLLLLFILTLSVISCQNNVGKVKKKIENKETNVTSLNFSVIDSLNKYTHADSLLIVNASLQALLFIGKTNNRNFAVWIIPDSLLVFFQHNTNNQWIATDTLKYKLDFSFVKYTDLNGDNRKDICVSCINDAAGNALNTVFLFNNHRKAFYHNTYYDLPNVMYDTQNKFIKAWYLAGAMHCQDKWKYKITGDSLTFETGVTYCPEENTNREKATIEFYKEIGGKHITTKRLTGKQEIIWNMFETALWK